MGDTHEIIKQLKPKDDIFFGMLMKNKEVCQEVLRVLLGDSGLIVESCEDQKSFTNAIMRSVRVDAFCKFSSGEYGSVEMQRSSEDGNFSWHERRVRYNASSITVNLMTKGEDFFAVPKLYMVYITEKDIFLGGRALYQISRTVSLADGQKMELDNGLYEYYANLAVYDKTPASELLKLFDKSEVTGNPMFPKFTEYVKYYKENKEGVKYMSSVLQELREEGREEGRAEYMVKAVHNAMKLSGMTLEKACELFGCRIEEYEEALRLIQEKDK